MSHMETLLASQSPVELLPNLKIRRCCLVALEGGRLGDAALQGKRHAKAREQVTCSSHLSCILGLVTLAATKDAAHQRQENPGWSIKI